jgi:hypothetical protein
MPLPAKRPFDSSEGLEIARTNLGLNFGLLHGNRDCCLATPESGPPTRHSGGPPPFATAHTKLSALTSTECGIASIRDS